MAQTILNISEISNTIPVERKEVVSYSENFRNIEKIKHNLGLLYFAGFAVLLTTLFL